MSFTPARSDAPQSVGRYALHAQIAAGGMASVHFGCLSGPVGFSKVVAIKRMRPALARNPDFVSMFVDEAKLASRVQHPNVVPILDVVADGGEIFIVMEYVHGQSLGALLAAAARTQERISLPIATSVLCGVLEGLHAAHEARDRRGQLLGIVHRDVSPQNVMVGADGLARIMDFGVAKAESRLSTTQDGQLKGKLSYMAPEQIRGQGIDRRADVFAAAAVLWGVLAGRRLFRGDDVADTMTEVLRSEVPPLATFRSDVPAALEAAIRSALEVDRDRRPATARELARAIEATAPRAPEREVGAWVERLAADVLATREAEMALIEDTGVGAGDADTTDERRNASPIVDEPSMSTAPTIELPAPAPKLVEPEPRPAAVAVPQPRSTSRAVAPAVEKRNSPADTARTGAFVAALVALSLIGVAWVFSDRSPGPAAAAQPPPSAPSAAVEIGSAAPSIAEPVATATAAPAPEQPPTQDRSASGSRTRPRPERPRPAPAPSAARKPAGPTVGHIPAEP